MVGAIMVRAPKSKARAHAMMAGRTVLTSKHSAAKRHATRIVRAMALVSKTATAGQSVRAMSTTVGLATTALNRDVLPRTAGYAAELAPASWIATAMLSARAPRNGGAVIKRGRR